MLDTHASMRTRSRGVIALLWLSALFLVYLTSTSMQVYITPHAQVQHAHHVPTHAWRFPAADALAIAGVAHAMPQKQQRQTVDAPRFATTEQCTVCTTFAPLSVLSPLSSQPPPRFGAAVSAADGNGGNAEVAHVGESACVRECTHRWDTYDCEWICAQLRGSLLDRHTNTVHGSGLNTPPSAHACAAACAQIGFCVPLVEVSSTCYVPVATLFACSCCCGLCCPVFSL
jgi:hypothetical protein